VTRRPAGDAINSLAVVANAPVVLSHRFDCEMLLVTFKYCSAAAAAAAVERPLATGNEQQELIKRIYVYIHVYHSLSLLACLKPRLNFTCLYAYNTL